MAGPTTTDVHIPSAMRMGKGRAKTEEPRKSKESVNYRRGEGDRTCRACRFYAANVPDPDEGADNRCLVVDGEISPDGLCDRFEQCEQMAEATYAVLIPVRKGLDDVLMFPFGAYYRDGERREFTREDGEEMVRNFQGNVLERRNGWLPVNREHDRAAGRTSYITDLWLADRGVRARIAPSEDTDKFDYISPEIKWEWTHPYTGEVHRNVLMGAGVTNYPYLLGRMSLHGAQVWTGPEWRVWTGSEWTPVIKMALAQITAASLGEAPDSEVLSLHRRTHQLWGANFAGNRRRSAGELDRNDLVIAHTLVRNEMAKRRMRHAGEPRDGLDEATHEAAGPAPAGRGRGVKKAALDLSNLPAEIMVTPDAVCVVGSAAAKGKGEDVDVLFRFELDENDPRHFKLRRENIDLPVRKALGVPKEDFHPLDNPQGPHAENIPLYDLVLRRKEARRAQVSKAAVSPGRRYTVMKPSMAGFTEFFNTKELWDEWAAEKIAEGHPLLGSPKIDGFRTVLGWNGDSLTAWFEDSKETKHFPAAASSLRGKRPFVAEGEFTAKMGDKWVARTQLAAVAAGSLDATPHFWMYDLLYAGDDVHEQPAADRLKQLRGLKLPGRYFTVLEQRKVSSAQSLTRVGKWAAGQPHSEGLFLRQADAPYHFGSTDTCAKFKTVFEIKVIVLDVLNRANGHVYRCGLRGGGHKNTLEYKGQEYVDLGNTFVSKTRMAGRGDTLNVRIEELLVLDDGRLAWGKPTPVGADKSRPAYTAEQAVKMAGRAHVLKREIAKAALKEEETRGERAAQLWAKHWPALVAKGGGSFILHGHFPALTDEEKGMSLEQLLRAGKSYHTDLRMDAPSPWGAWGFTNYEGKSSAVGAKGTRLYRMPPNKPMRGGFKLEQPQGWLRVGIGKPLVTQNVGVTGKGNAKFFALDHGKYKLTYAREHSFEALFSGKSGVLSGRYQINYVPVGGGRVWMISRPADQESTYPQEHGLESVVKELKRKGQKWLFWRETPDAELRRIDVTKAEVEKAATLKSAAQRLIRDLNTVLAQRDVPAAVRKEAKDLRRALRKSWAQLAADEEGGEPEEHGDREPFVHEVPFSSMDARQRITYGVVLEPGEVDAQGHEMTAEDIEAACHRFMEGAQALDLHHARLVQSEEAKVVECWIQREPAEWQLGLPDGTLQLHNVKAGSWCLGVKHYSDELWSEVERGEITGYSVVGWGVLTALENAK